MMEEVTTGFGVDIGREKSDANSFIWKELEQA
jgi:hypothetical protein